MYYAYTAPKSKNQFQHFVYLLLQVVNFFKHSHLIGDSEQSQDFILELWCDEDVMIHYNNIKNAHC